MKDLQLAKANELKEAITKVFVRLDNWKNAIRLEENSISVVVDGENGKFIRTLLPDPKLFEIAKALSISHWEKELKRLQEEFDAL